MTPARAKCRVPISCANGLTTLLAADKVRGIVNDEAVRGSADALSVAPRPYHLRRGDADFVVFGFAKPEERKPSPSASVASNYRIAGGDKMRRSYAGLGGTIGAKS